MNSSASRAALSRVLSAGATVLSARVLLIVLSFGNVGLLARAMPAAHMGSYFLVLSIAGFVALMASFGLPGLAVREISRLRTLGDTSASDTLAACLFAIALRMMLLVTGCGTLLAVGSVVGVLRVDGSLVALAALLAGATGLQALQAEVFRGYGRIVESSIFGGLCAAAVTFALVAGCLLMHVPLDASIAVALGLGGVVFSLGAGFLRLPRLRWRIGSAAAREHILNGRPFWVIGTSAFLLFQADLWVAGWLLPLEQVALYGAAARLVQPLLLPVEATEAAIAPDIVSLHVGGANPELGALLYRAACIQLILVIAGMLTLAMGGRLLLQALFGSGYGEAYPLMVVLAAGFCVRAASGPFGYLLALTGHARPLATLSLAWAGATLVVDSVAGWVAGPMGVASASALMLSTFCVLGIAAARRLTGLNAGAFPIRPH